LFIKNCFYFTFSNLSNEKVDGGYAAYVYSNPIFGSKEFKQVITGPGGTGMVWRQDSIQVCVTPYTMTESFDDIRAADQLKMNAEAHLVWRIDPTKVKEFVEQYGALAEVDHTPQAIAEDAYESFVKQPFRTAVRTSIAEYRGLEAPANIPAITDKVTAILKQHFEGTPFIIESVTIGHTIPPESVTAGITRKVEATQEYERQAIQLEIAKRNEEIQIAEGRAAANRVREEAQGALDKAKAEADAELYRQQQAAAAVLAMRTAEAQGMKLEAEGRKALNDAIGDNLIRYEAIQRIGDAKVPHINVGTDAVRPLMNVLQQAFGN
jgi:regulator of protease activity HflC (stomatin/prohibitin superfamily)